MNTQDEIERRFLTTSLKWLSLVGKNQYRHIRQGYPPTLKEGEFSRIRATTRQDGSVKYERCNKGISDGLASPEREWAVAAEEAVGCFNICANQELIKLRHRVCLSFVIDQFLTIRNKQSNLVISKVRFDTIEEAKAFVLPDWIGGEITGNHRWSNLSFCLHGVPKY
jgi:adenylate cyclase